MKIALCDDQKSILEELSCSIRNFFEKQKLPYEFLYFSKPSLLFAHMQEEPVELIFMDLDFHQASEDGILWSKKIKKTFPRTIIIILTAYEHRYKEGYEARAFRFMTKPVSEEELSAYLTACIEELELTRSISLVRRGIPHNISIRDIYYLSAQSGGSELWTSTTMYGCEESLLQWEQRLPMAAFFRCHSKYLVNLMHVENFEHQLLTLTNGEKIPISRRKWKAFQLAYMKFDTTNYEI